MAKRPRHDGFMLLATLVLLALVAVLLAGMSRTSALRAIEARDAEAALQRRWAETSARDTLLPRAAELLEAANARRATLGERPRADVWATLELGGYRMAVLIADEQAKVNVNTLHARLSEERVAQRLRTLLPPDAGEALVDLRPDPRATGATQEALTRGKNAADGNPQGAAGDGTDGDPPHVAPRSGPPAFGAYGQVFARSEAAWLFGDDEKPGLAERITVFGDGRLSLKMCSPEAFAVAVTGVLTDPQARRIMEARREQPDGEPEQWISAAGASDDKKQELTALLTDRSSVHSLAVAFGDGWRTTWSLAVREVEVDESDEEEQPSSPDALRQRDDEHARVYRMMW